MSPQKWIDRYVAEVGRMLPERNRADVEKEIRSLLHDALDAQTAGAEPTDEQVMGILGQFGSPREMAMRYGASQYLIGPLLYPTFVAILRLVVGIVLAVSLFGVVISIAQSPPRLEDAFAMVGGIVGSIVQAAAWVVLVFALLERLNLRELEKISTPWDPRSLPPAENYDHVSAFETILTVVFTTAFLVFLNVILDSQGRIAVEGGDWTSMELFSAEFLRYIPWMTALLAAEMVVAVAALIRGRWTTLLRLLNIALNGAGIALAYLMLTGPSLAASEAFDLAFRIVVAIVLVANVIEAVQQVYRLWRSRARAGAAAARQSVH
ncbi:MAG: hypothetical protein V9H69_25910 [Anaerolineae bacterium]